MKKVLFVAGLDYSITDENLATIFADYGTVESAKVVMDKYTGRSRGFAFVEMSTQEEAQACIQNLNDASLKGRQLVVKFKEDKPAGGSSNTRRSFNRSW